MKVCCILLTADRQDYTERAVVAFLSQTYQDKELLIYDTGHVPYELRRHLPRIFLKSIILVRDVYGIPKTIGELRNHAIELARYADIIAHMDSDDYMGPDHLTNMVRELSPLLNAVGYSTMLFWHVARQQAWLYTAQSENYIVGTSLVYWRRVWHDYKFPATSQGEENSLNWQGRLRRKSFPTTGAMIADVHGSNTASRVDFDSHPQWKRVPEWDDYCRQRSLRKFMEEREACAPIYDSEIK